MKKEKIYCAMCSKEFFGFVCMKRKFCSLACSYKSKIKPRDVAVCLTCHKEFPIKRNSCKGKFCSSKCVRYQGSKESLKTRLGKGFWKTATEEQKLQRTKEIYGKLVIRSDGCWGWKNKALSSGYAVVNCGANNPKLAHRISWIIHNGAIPKGLWVLHRCDNPICTNPEHLFLGTPKDNTVDMMTKGRKKWAIGVERWNAKLSNENAKEIKLLLRGDLSQYYIAKRFNVSRGTIQDIFRGKTWKHII